MTNSSQLHNSLIWSAIEKFSIIGIQIIFEILMARILSPKEYGVMGMLLVVMSFTQIFIDTGFGNALIFKKDRTEIDFATAFYSSGILGIIIFLILFFTAPFLSDFYKQDITLYIQIIAITIIFNSLSVIYKTRLTILIDFKSQAKFSFMSVLASGCLGLITAYYGLGIWALIIQNLSLSFFNLILLCINLKWFPKKSFSKKSFLELFGYSSKLLYAAIINSIYINFNSIILGKFYSTKFLGIYTKSYQFTIYPVSMLTGIIQRVFFPYLTKFQKNHEELFKHTNYYNNLIFVTLLPIMTVLILLSNVLIRIVLSEQWLEMVEPFNILLIATLFYPLIVMNMNIFQVIGETSKYLFVEILTKIVGIVILLFCYKYGLSGICIGILIQFTIQYLITSYFVAKVLQNNFLKSLKIFIYISYGILIYMLGLLILNMKMFNIFIMNAIVIIIFVAVSYLLLYFLLYRKQFNKVYKKIISK